MAGKSYFLPVLSEFFSEYLPKTKGLGANTIRSYKHAFRLLLEYVHVKHGLLPEKIEFRHLENGIAGAWLDWLCTGRGVFRRNEEPQAVRARYVRAVCAPQQF